MQPVSYPLRHPQDVHLRAYHPAGNLGGKSWSLEILIRIINYLQNSWIPLPGTI
jgi:hypothetical protein